MKILFPGDIILFSWITAFLLITVFSVANPVVVLMIGWLVGAVSVAVTC